LLLILGVGYLPRHGRSATNAVGNSIAASVVAKWEGGLLSEREAEATLSALMGAGSNAASGHRTVTRVSRPATPTLASAFGGPCRFGGAGLGAGIAVAQTPEGQLTGTLQKAHQRDGGDRLPRVVDPAFVLKRAKSPSVTRSTSAAPSSTP
jgi:hypothetical protein